jgi:hypothetical protein
MKSIYSNTLEEDNIWVDPEDNEKFSFSPPEALKENKRKGERERDVIA